MQITHSKLLSVVLSLSIILTPALTASAEFKQLTITDFKGLATKVSSYDLAPDYATICQNSRFDKTGSINKRYSRSKYNSTSLGSNPITHVDRVYIGSNKYLIAVYDTILKVGNDAAGTFSNLKTGLTTGKRYRGATYKDFHYLGNGTDSNIRTDGTATNTKIMGCAIPGSGTTATPVAGAGLGIGAYKYKVTFLYDGYQESNGQATSSDATTTAGNQQVNLASIPTGATGQGVTARKIYRTTVGGSLYYYLTTINNNTTTTYSDTTADGSLSSTQIPTDHDIPLNFEYIRELKERLFMNSSTNSSWLYYTLIEDVTSYPDIVPSTNYFPISEDDGDEISGIAIDPLGMLTVFKKNSIRKVFTEGAPSSWEISASFSPNGCIAPYSIAESSYGIIYLSRTGNKKEIRVFDGQTSKLISERIELTLVNIADSYITNCVGIYHEGRYLLAYTDSTTGATTNNRVIIYDFNTDKFSIDVKNIASFCVWNAGDDWGEFYTGDSNVGFVYREETYEQDIKHKTKSDLDTGSYDNCQSSGTEEVPEVNLITADLSLSVGAQIANTLTVSAASTYSGEDDTAWPSGDLKSASLQISAKTLKKIYWTESLGSTGDITLQIRTGNTVAAVNAAAWSSKYTDPTGSDISAETAAVYIQYQARLYTENINTITTPKLYRSDYVIWISAGLGTIAESSIDFIYATGDLDFGSPFLRKRFRDLRTKADIGGTSYTVKYYLDGSSSELGTFTISDDSKVSYFPLTAFGERLRLRIDENSISTFDLRELTVVYSEEPYR